MKFRIKFKISLNQYHNKFLSTSDSTTYKLSYTGNGMYTVFRLDNSIVSENIGFNYIKRSLEKSTEYPSWRWKLFDKNPIESD